MNLSRLKQIAELFGVEPSSLFDDGKKVFNFNGNNNGYVNQHTQNQSGFGMCSPEYLQLQSELEKQRALNEQQAQEVLYLRGLVDSFLKKEN